MNLGHRRLIAGASMDFAVSPGMKGTCKVFLFGWVDLDHFRVETTVSTLRE